MKRNIPALVLALALALSLAACGRSEETAVCPADGCGRQGGEHHPLPDV